MIDKNSESLAARLVELETEHRDLDEVIARLSENATVDQLRLRRLKKRKLLLKDTITYMRNQLIPDIDA